LPSVFYELFDITAAGLMLALGLVLTFMNIPFGRGILTFVAFSMIGTLSEGLVQAATALAPQAFIFKVGEMEIPLSRLTYFSIIGVGFIATIMRHYREGAANMLQAAAGYLAGTFIDYVTISQFVSTIGLAFRKLFLYDYLIYLVYTGSQNVATAIAQTIGSSILSIAGSFAFLTPELGFSLAIGITLAVINFVTGIADTIHAYISRLVTGFITLISGVGEGSLIIILTIALTLAMSGIVVNVYGLAYSTMIGLYAWLFTLFVVMYMLRLVQNLLTLAIGAVAGQGAGSLIVGRILSGLRAVGGAPYREARAVIFGSIATVVSYVIGGTSFYPILVAAAVIMCLANTVYAARLVIGVPKRFLSRYIGAVYTLTMYAVAVKLIAAWVGSMLSAYIANFDPIISFLGLENVPIIGDIIKWIKSVADALLQAAADP